MVLKEILETVQNATHPVAKVLHKMPEGRVLGLAFKNGMVLKEHKAHLPSKLTVLQGEVVYTQGDLEVLLKQYETVDIPVEVVHHVTAKLDSLCILTQG